jgi:hypothetical protein
MNKFWSLFWRLFGAGLLIAIIIGCVAGIIGWSADIGYITVRYTLAVGLGVCGFIGFVIVPIELYFKDKKQRKKNHVVT